MKKPYCRPQLTVIVLETQDIVCSSIIEITSDISFEPKQSGELPPHANYPPLSRGYHP